jgi:hypothetical protein
MAMIACPECSTNVSDKAPVCPKCGAPVGHAQAPGADETIYSDGAMVRITRARAILGSKTYAISNITSVSIVSDKDQRWAYAVLAVVFGACGISCATGDSAELSVIGFVPAVYFVYKFINGAPFHHVHISGSSGEENAIPSRSLAHIRRIVDAISEAIVRRG